MISCVWLLVFYCYLTLPQNQQLILLCMWEVQGRFSWALVRISQDKTRWHLDWALPGRLEENNFQNHSSCWQILVPCDCVQVFGFLLPVSEGLLSAPRPRGFFQVTLLQQQAAEVPWINFLPAFYIWFPFLLSADRNSLLLKGLYD